MQYPRSTLCILFLASSLAGCSSYTRHEADEERPYYYDRSDCSGGYPCSSNPGTYHVLYGLIEGA